MLIPVILHSVFDEVHGSTLTFARRVLIPCAGPAVGLLGVAYATAHLRVNQSTQLVLGSVATLAAALIAVIAVPATRRETAEMAAVLRRCL